MFIVPGVIICLAVGSYIVNRKRKGEMTPERMRIFTAAINGSLKDPAKLDQLADAFDKEQLSEHAKLLRQRAALKRLPKPVQKARQAVFRKAMQSKNKAAVLKLADEFDAQGATGAALKLRQYGVNLPDSIPEPAPEPAPVSHEQPVSPTSEAKE